MCFVLVILSCPPVEEGTAKEIWLFAALGNEAVTCTYSGCILCWVFFSELTLGGTVHIGKRRFNDQLLNGRGTGSDQGLRVTCAGITTGRLVVLFDQNSYLGCIPHPDEWEVIRIAEGHIRPLCWPCKALWINCTIFSTKLVLFILMT